MFAYGLGLNAAPSGLGAGPGGGLFGFVTAKFNNLSSAITAAASQIDPTVAATVQGYVTQSQNFFNSSYQNDVPNGYSCALNSLASADSYVRAHLSGFGFGQPPAGNPNPAGDVDGRLANLFLTINTYFFMQPPNATWPTTNVPPCVTLTASPASVTQGSASTLNWGPAATAYPLAFPPAQCSLSASDGTFTTPTAEGPSGTSVSTGNLTMLGTYTAALECIAPGGATVPGITTTVLTGLASTSVSVIPPPVLTSITLTPLTASVGDLFNQQFSAVGTYSYGPTQDVTNSVAWSSSNPAVATIAAGGSAFCLTSGTVTVTAILGGVQASGSLTCLNVVSNLGLFVPGGVTTLSVGGTVQLTAQAAYTVGPPANVNASANWVSTNPAIVTVSSGLVTAVSPGQASVYATINDPTVGLVTSPMAAFTVSAPVTLKSLTLHPSTPQTLQVQCPVQFTVYGNYSNGTTQNLTSSATWTSSNPKVATVSGGLVKPLCKGTTTISATVAGVPMVSLVVTVKGGY
jgi:trimeric autotransporter adhesin